MKGLKGREVGGGGKRELAVGDITGEGTVAGVGGGGDGR